MERGPPLQLGASSPSRHLRWIRWGTAALAAYLLVWGVTWRLAPADLRDAFAVQYASATERDGSRVPVAFQPNCDFAGEGSRYGPDPRPQARYWCCVGRPTVPAPFVVTAEFAYVTGPQSAGAGRATLLWTPWTLYPLHRTMVPTVDRPDGD